MANAEQEPTMEEILASIRRIINEDEDEAAPAAAAVAEPSPAPEAEPELVEEDDVLELTERVAEHEAAGTEPVSISDDLMILDREEEPEMEVEPEPEPEPEFEAAPEPAPAAPQPAARPAAAAAAPQEEDSLLGAASAGVAASAFAALSENLRVSSDQGQTLEGIVRELMRPMLKQWLDDNLPAIVEEKVQAEIDRVARRRS